jgi:molybdopterin converting factor small subunit
MLVTTIFFGPLERWAGHKTMISNGSNIREVFEALEPHLGKSLIDHLTIPATSEIRSHFHVLLNGIDTDSKTCLLTPIQDNDVLTIVPPIGGG